MKKNLFAVALLAGAVSMATAQTSGKVGVNTSTPQATLDVKPSAANAAATATTNEGLLIPRLTKARVANIAAANLVEGTQVYVTDDVSAADSATFTGTGKGFYYYNGTKWVKQSDANANAAAGVTAQNGLSMNGSAVELGGTLLKSTNIAQAGFNLTTTGAGNVGIGTNAPAAKLDVDGRVRIDSSNPIVLGVGIAEYATAWARGLVFNNMAQNQYYGGFMAYGVGSDTEAGVRRYIIGKYGTDELVQVFPLTSATANKLTKLNTRLQITDLPEGTDADAILVTDPAGNIRKLGSLSGAVAANGEWVYTAGTNTIDLRRSGTGTFTNKVQYNNANGSFANYDAQQYETLEAGSTVTKAVNLNEAKNLYISTSQNIPLSVSNVGGLAINSKRLVASKIVANESAPIANFDIEASRGEVYTSTTNQSPTRYLVGSGGSVFKNDNNITNYLTAGNFSGQVFNGSVNGYLNGVRAEAYANTSGAVASIAAVNNYTTIGSAQTGRVGYIYGVSGGLNFMDNTNVVANDAIGVSYFNSFYPNANPTLTNLIGFRYGGISRSAGATGTITNHYGVKIENVAGATNNFALYTGTGKVSFGDEVEVRNANVRANSFIAATSTYPDYVFQNYYTGTASNLNPNYKFTSLAETEKFIKDNGHLPGFEKAETVVAKGEFSVSETALKSLEKIEELYLHVIELEKRVKSLEKENAELKAVK